MYNTQAIHGTETLGIDKQEQSAAVGQKAGHHGSCAPRGSKGTDLSKYANGLSWIKSCIIDGLCPGLNNALWTLEPIWIYMLCPSVVSFMPRKSTSISFGIFKTSNMFSNLCIALAEPSKAFNHVCLHSSTIPGKTSAGALAKT